jgi:hypothetical protein
MRLGLNHVQSRLQSLAEGVHEPTVRTPAIGRWDRDLVWPATINRRRGQLALPPTHGPSH